MCGYFEKDPCTSFGFVAASDIATGKVQNVPNKRFRFYRRMMLSIFGPETFAQGYDQNASVYLLINRRRLAVGELCISQIEAVIAGLYAGDYGLTLEP